MAINLIKIGLVGCLLTSPAFSSASVANDAVIGDIPGASDVDERSTWKDLPLGFRKGSDVEYDMEDWNLILSKSVFFSGRSDLTRAKRPSAYRKSLGSRIINESRSPYRLEGNKVLFHMLNERHQLFIQETLDRFQKLPSVVPLETMSRQAQLAYWLNLRNLASFSEIAERYPISNLKRLFDEDGEARTRKSLTVLGINLSIADIEQYIIRIYNDPIVFYGFYQGTIGGPNIGPRAFTAGNVFEMLESNAVDYINSLRGVQVKATGSRARVSKLYSYYPELFDLQSVDFVQHMQTYAEGTRQIELGTVLQAKADIEEWGISDLINGKPYVSPNALRTVGADGVRGDSSTTSNALPRHARALLQQIERRNYRRFRDLGTTVTVEKLSEAEKAAINELKGLEEPEDDEVEINNPKTKKDCEDGNDDCK